MYTLNCINLKHRKDRMEKIKKIFSNQNLFKIKRFNAISHPNGAIGCLSSHLELIKLNYNNPFIIVIEDDIILKETLENIYNLIEKLFKVKYEWDIFNGNPSFWNYMVDKKGNTKKNNNQKLIHSIIEKSPFVNITWGQSTAFMIYKKKSYDKLIYILEKEKIKKKNFQAIDLLISKNFIQTCYGLGHLVYQNEDWSDISKTNMNTIILDGKKISYINYQKKCETLLTHKTNNLLNIIY